MYLVTSNSVLFHHIIFFFNDTATTEIYTLSLHDALPISPRGRGLSFAAKNPSFGLIPLVAQVAHRGGISPKRSEEHTSELQSHLNLVCRLLLEKKKVIERKPEHILRENLEFKLLSHTISC